MKLLCVFALSSLCCLIPEVLLAQAELKATIPANGTVIRAAPEALELSFSEDVQLLKLAVSGIESKMIPTSFKPTGTAQRTFSIPLPALGEDAYVVAWTVVGQDGHQTQDKLTFVVDADAAEKAGTTGESHIENNL